MHTNETLTALLVTLVTLRTEVKFGKFPRTGICSYVGLSIPVYVTGYSALMLDLFHSWPKFSGNEDYPVPCPYDVCPKRAYSCQHNLTKEHRWGDNAYADLRRELLDYMIDELTRQLSAA